MPPLVGDPSPPPHLDDVLVGAALVRLVVLCVLEQHLVHVAARVLEQPVGAVEDDERNLAVAQHAQLVRLLHQAELALRERHLRVRDTPVASGIEFFLKIEKI